MYMLTRFQTPLHMSAMNGRIECVRELIASGANVFAENVCE